MKQFHVSHDGEELGPFSAQAIADKVKAGELSPMDFVFDVESDDWVAIMQFSEISSLLELKRPKPKAPPKKAESDEESHENKVVEAKSEEQQATEASEKSEPPTKEPE